jgi:hypothetical protein
MSSLFSYFTSKTEKVAVNKPNNYLLQLLQNSKDLWEIVQAKSDRVVCCPDPRFVYDKISHSDLESHILIPSGGPGSFLSLSGSTVVFIGYIIQNYHIYNIRLKSNLYILLK